MSNMVILNLLKFLILYRYKSIIKELCTQAINDNMLIYQSADGKIKIDVRFEKETVWLTQAQMCVLFGRERSVITKHIKIYLQKTNLMKIAMCKICTLQILINQ